MCCISPVCGIIVLYINCNRWGMFQLDCQVPAQTGSLRAILPVDRSYVNRHCASFEKTMKNKIGKILFVDDDKVVREAFESLARDDFPYEYTVACSVKEAADILELEKFDAAVLDHFLEDGTSFDLFEKSKNIPIIVITGVGDEEIAVRAMRAGAFNCLTKDIEYNYLKVLSMAIENAISWKREDETHRKYRKNLEKLIGKRTAELQKEIDEREHGEKELESALNELQQSHEEITLLLDAAHAVLEHREFKDAARDIYNICKGFIGATAGYIALLSPDGREDELAFLDSDGLGPTEEQSRTMPVRGLRAKVYRSRMTIYENGFKNSKCTEFMPKGHAELDNVMFAPMVIKGEAVGLICLADKQGGFSEYDSRVASEFAEIAAVALKNGRTMKSLENSEERTRLIVDNALDAVVTMDGNGKISGWNRQAEAIFGWPRSEIVGHKLSSKIIPKKYREEHEHGLKHFVETGEGAVFNKRFEFTAIHRDGHEFPVELSISPPGRLGESFFFSAFVHDITERKRVEDDLYARQQEIERFNSELEKRVQDELQKGRQKDLIMMHQSRRAAMGQMIELIAHQWKQPLNAINIILYNIRDCMEDKKISINEIDDFIVNGENLIKKMAMTIDDFKDFFKPNKKKKKFVVNQVVKDTLSLLNASFKYDNISVSVKEEDEEIIAYGFPNEYSQVLLNILDNAEDAIIEKGGEGKIRIEIKNKNNYALVKIKDNGGGIPKDILDKIFDSYFTTKKNGKGSGIGLYMSRVIIEEHMDGKIEVQNRKDGAEFRIITQITGS